MTSRPGWAMLSTGMAANSRHGRICAPNTRIVSPRLSARIRTSPPISIQVARRRRSVTANKMSTTISGTPRYQGLSPHRGTNIAQCSVNRPGVTYRRKSPVPFAPYSMVAK